MIFRGHRRRQTILATTVIGFTAAGLALPLLVNDAGERVLPGSSVVAAIRDRYTLTSPVRLLSLPPVTVESGTIGISSAQASRARTGEAVTALLTSGSAKLVLDGGFIRIDAPRAQTDDGATHGEVLAPMLKAFLQLAFEGLSLRRCTVAMRQADGTDIVLDNVNAEIGLQRKSIVTKGEFEHRGQRLTFDTVLGLLDKRSGGHLPIKASIKGDLVDSQIDGTLVVAEGLQLSGAQVVMTSPDIRRVANWLGAGWPAGPGLGYFRAEGKVDWADRVATFQKAAFSLDGNQATGTLTFSFAGPRPSIEGTLALSRLDLSRYMTSDDGLSTTREAVLGRSLASWLERPATLSLPLLPLIDADLRISSAQTSAGPVGLGRSAATLSLKSGKLLADIAEVEIDSGARGSGQISADMSRSEPRYSVRGKIEGIDSSRLATALLGQQALRGRADIVLDLAGSGDTGERFLASLTGKASLALPNGGQVGIDVPALIEQSTASSMDWQEVVPGPTTVDKLGVQLQFSPGFWSANNVTATLGDSVYAAAGRLSLAAGTLDLLVTKSPMVPEDAKGPQRPFTTERIVLRGPWRTPAITPEAGAPAAADGPPMPPVSENKPTASTADREPTSVAPAQGEQR